MNHSGTAPWAQARAGARLASESLLRKAMASEVPSVRRKASRVAFGLLEAASAALRASATILAERDVCSFSYSNCSGETSCRATPPSTSAASTIATIGSDSRARRESLFHIWTIPDPAETILPFKLPADILCWIDEGRAAGYAQIRHEGIDRRRPSGGRVRLPLAVRLRRLREDRRGGRREIRPPGLHAEASRRHGDRHQASRCFRLRTDAAHPQGRSGRQDHHVQHERRPGLRGAGGRAWARRAMSPRATIRGCS